MHIKISLNQLNTFSNSKRLSSKRKESTRRTPRDIYLKEVLVRTTNSYNMNRCHLIKSNLKTLKRILRKFKIRLLALLPQCRQVSYWILKPLTSHNKAILTNSILFQPLNHKDTRHKFTNSNRSFFRISFKLQTQCFNQISWLIIFHNTTIIHFKYKNALASLMKCSNQLENRMVVI